MHVALEESFTDCLELVDLFSLEERPPAKLQHLGLVLKWVLDH